MIVNGDTTTLNTSELTVDDVRITVADGTTDADTAAANGAGLAVGTITNATLQYNSAGRFDLGLPLHIAGNQALTVGSALSDWPALSDKQATLTSSVSVSVDDLNVNGIAALAATSVLTGTGSTTWDVSQKQMAIVTASGSNNQITVSNVSSLPTGAGLTLIVNDAASASLHATPITGATSVKYPAATAPTLSGTAGEVLVVSLIHTGSGNLIASQVTVS